MKVDLPAPISFNVKHFSNIHINDFFNFKIDCLYEYKFRNAQDFFMGDDTEPFIIKQPINNKQKIKK